MRGLRVRWSGMARVAGVALAALVAFEGLPELLKPPAPPPLAADVGLPRVARAAPRGPGPARKADPSQFAPAA